ncbi:MAG TPA: ABC transporter ATP-binding protein, partial [Bdellovibrionales bacterium]|nr:ABC transporter ATP-binding protein [Bdellovibrionales bacterium]
ENGAGKSTLMKMLFGLYRPDSGRILLDGQEVAWRTPLDAIARGIGMVQQHFTLVGPLSAIDNIILGAERAGTVGLLDRKKAIEDVCSVLPSKKLEVPWHEKTENLSVGDRQKIEILKLLYRRAELLILDEPTAVLTPQEVEDFFEMLRQLKAAGKTIVIISHKLGEIFSLCDEFTVLRAGRVTGRGAIRDVTPEKIVQYMMGESLKPLSEDRAPVWKDTVITCRGLTERQKKRGALNDLSLDVHAGEIVGVAGVEGAGQSSLVQALMGLLKPEGQISILGQIPGTAREARELGVGLIPEDRIEEGLWPAESGFHNLVIGLEERFSRFGLLDDTKIEADCALWAKSFDVRAASLKNQAGSFSGGNQQKLIFAREVAGREPRVLICHQPTRGVDLGAVRHIHETLIQLRNKGLGVLVLSSDLDELMELSDRIYVLFDGRVSGRFERGKFERAAIGRAMAGLT